MPLAKPYEFPASIKKLNPYCLKIAKFSTNKSTNNRSLFNLNLQLVLKKNDLH